MQARTDPKLHPAFSLIELLIAMGVLVILLTMLFLGGRKLLASNKAASTKVTLAALQGMLAEFDAKTRLSKPPQKWLWTGAGNPPVVDPLVVADVDFWRIPYHGNPPLRELDALDAPGTVSDENPGSESYLIRNGSRQVVNTQMVMNLILGLPSNRAALEKIPPERYFVPAYVTGSIPSPGNEGVLYFGGAGVPENIHYLPGSYVQHSSGKFRCTDPLGTSATPAPNQTTPWSDKPSPATPLILDAWNNPIIFVPGTGLRVRMLNGEKANIPGNFKQTFTIISPEGKVDYSTGNGPRVVQAGRPFFASAGEDGDFAKGDDNIYSFQQ